MGALSQPRKNPYVMYGLVPGTTLRMEVAARGLVESLATRVEEVDGEVIGVLVPIVRLKPRPSAAGTVVHAQYLFRNRRWTFESAVTGHSPDGTVEFLAAPKEIDSHERRASYRLETALKPKALYRLVVDAATVADDDDGQIVGTVVDLSEGGVCLSTRESLRQGERLGIQLDLPHVGKIHARMRVQGVDSPRRDQVAHRVHCIFTDIGLSDRDRVARYVMRRQIEMRRRGQL